MKEEEKKTMEHECGYVWVPRVPEPRACPNCKRQIYYGPINFNKKKK